MQLRQVWLGSDWALVGDVRLGPNRGVVASRQTSHTPPPPLSALHCTILEWGAGKFCYDTTDSVSGDQSWSLSSVPGQVWLYTFKPKGSTTVATSLQATEIDLNIGTVGGSGSWT